MAFEELRERFQIESKARWEQFQESSIYIQVKEKYENLTPVMQKVTVVGICVLLLYTVLAVPLGMYSTSHSYVTEFEDKRELIRDLLKSSREAQESPNLAVPPPIESLKAQIDSQLQTSKLLPEQNGGSEVLMDKPRIIPGNLAQGVLSVKLNKLNIRQILDLGHQFQSINTSVKMTDLVMQANTQDPRYFDVVYKLAVLSVPSFDEMAAEPEQTPPPRRGRK